MWNRGAETISWQTNCMSDDVPMDSLLFQFFRPASLRGTTQTVITSMLIFFFDVFKNFGEFCSHQRSDGFQIQLEFIVIFFLNECFVIPEELPEPLRHSFRISHDVIFTGFLAGVFDDHESVLQMTSRQNLTPSWYGILFQRN
jgi:hypothetical protein